MFRTIFNQRMLICILCGFSSGLPLYVLYQLIPAWLRSAELDLGTIGLFSLISIPYTWKFIWSPLMDGWKPFFWGRRRGWAMMTQMGLLLALCMLAFLDPQQDLTALMIVCGLIAFLSASQDIVLDAHRREILSDEELGIGNSYFVNAYRISGLVPGSLALILSDYYPWAVVHSIVASFVIIGMITTWWMPEPKIEHEDEAISFSTRIVEPFRAFFSRGVGSALLIALFMILYKLGDNMAMALATPFYMDVGFSNTMIGTTAKAGALWASIIGGIVGGIVMIKIGINRALWIFGVVQVISIVGFALLASNSPILDIVEQRPYSSLDEASIVPSAEHNSWLTVRTSRSSQKLSINEVSFAVFKERYAWSDDQIAEIIQKRGERLFRDAEDWSMRTEQLVPNDAVFHIWAHDASKEDLMHLLQVTEQHAKALLQLREQKGPFSASKQWSTDLTMQRKMDQVFYFPLDINTAKSQQLGQIPFLKPNAWLLFWVISFEYLGVGLGTAAFVAFTARATDKRYTATQYALLTSLAGLPRTFSSALTGFIIEAIGYVSFFFLCTMLALPGMILLIWVAPWNAEDSSRKKHEKSS